MGDGDDLGGVAGQKRLRESAGFGSENQMVAGLEVDIQVAAFAFGAAEPETLGWAVLQGFIQAFVHLQAEMIPVVQTGAFEGFVREKEAAGLNDVEAAVCAHAQSADIACVGGDLRLEEHHVEIALRQVHKPGRLLIWSCQMLSQRSSWERASLRSSLEFRQ